MHGPTDHTDLPCRARVHGPSGHTDLPAVTSSSTPPATSSAVSRLPSGDRGRRSRGRREETLFLQGEGGAVDGGREVIDR